MHQNQPSTDFQCLWKVEKSINLHNDMVPPYTCI